MGDHVQDVEGVLVAGVTSVSVLTGDGTREELDADGTHTVLPDLLAFPRWLQSHWPNEDTAP